MNILKRKRVDDELSHSDAKKRKLTGSESQLLLPDGIVGEIRGFCCARDWINLCSANRALLQTCLRFLFFSDVCFNVRPTLKILHDENRKLFVCDSRVAPVDNDDLIAIESAMVGKPISCTITLPPYTVQQHGEKLTSSTTNTLSLQHSANVDEVIRWFNGSALDLYSCDNDIKTRVDLVAHTNSWLLCIRLCVLRQSWFDNLICGTWRAVTLYGCTIASAAMPKFPPTIELVAIDCNSLHCLTLIMSALARDCPNLKILIIHPTVDWSVNTDDRTFVFPSLTHLVSLNTGVGLLQKIVAPSLETLAIPIESCSLAFQTMFGDVHVDGIIFQEHMATLTHSLSYNRAIRDVIHIPTYHGGLDKLTDAPTGIALLKHVYGTLLEKHLYQYTH